MLGTIMPSVADDTLMERDSFTVVDSDGTVAGTISEDEAVWVRIADAHGCFFSDGFDLLESNYSVGD